MNNNNKKEAFFIKYNGGREVSKNRDCEDFVFLQIVQIDTKFVVKIRGERERGGRGGHGWAWFEVVSIT
jgi:hypothetical protein